MELLGVFVDHVQFGYRVANSIFEYRCFTRRDARDRIVRIGNSDCRITDQFCFRFGVCDGNCQSNPRLYFKIQSLAVGSADENQHAVVVDLKARIVDLDHVIVDTIGVNHLDHANRVTQCECFWNRVKVKQHIDRRIRNRSYRDR